MPITTIEKDPTNLTMTIVADFPVPVRRLWDAYADPRQLEKCWRPPQWPATFTRHDLYPGGRSRYEMRGPDGQIDDVLADLDAFAAGRGTETQLLSDTQVRITRIIRGSREQVWQAHEDPQLLKRWLLGPEGWQMPVCEVAAEVGDTFRYEWETLEGEGRFGFTGELLERRAPNRSVTTERMTEPDSPETTNELTLTPVDGGTLLSLVITYPGASVRDLVLETGMAEGMEASYARLETRVL